MAFAGKYMLLFCSLICLAIGIFDARKENSNDGCTEEIQTLRQELDILRQELKLQGEEIKRLKRELPKNSDHVGDSREGDQFIKANPNRKESSFKQNMSRKSDHYQIEYAKKFYHSEKMASLRTKDKSGEVHNQTEGRYRQGRLLLSPPDSSVSSNDNSPQIAFFANTVKHNSNLAMHETLIFGNVLTNDGNYYHHFTGNFIPNVSGVYVFHVQILICHMGQDFRTELVVEGIVRDVHFAGDSSFCSNGGGMSILHVNAGESVWVRVKTPGTGNSIAYESSFAGFLLYRH